LRIIGVYRSHKHRGRRINHRSKTKQPYHVYYWDEIANKFGSFSTDAVSAMAFKLQKCKRTTFTCLVCGSKTLAIYRNDRELRESRCFACGTSLVESLNAIEEMLE
jgi:hypothetical protein